jgi:hypothetical protein
MTTLNCWISPAVGGRTDAGSCKLLCPLDAGVLLAYVTVGTAVKMDRAEMISAMQSTGVLSMFAPDGHCVEIDVSTPRQARAAFETYTMTIDQGGENCLCMCLPLLLMEPSDTADQNVGAIINGAHSSGTYVVLLHTTRALPAGTPLRFSLWRWTATHTDRRLKCGLAHPLHPSLQPEPHSASIDVARRLFNEYRGCALDMLHTNKQGMQACAYMILVRSCFQIGFSAQGGLCLAEIVGGVHLPEHPAHPTAADVLALKSDAAWIVHDTTQDMGTDAPHRQLCAAHALHLIITCGILNSTLWSDISSSRQLLLLTMQAWLARFLWGATESDPWCELRVGIVSAAARILTLYPALPWAREWASATDNLREFDARTRRYVLGMK